jgi:putative FmdB family regulatory protein
MIQGQMPIYEYRCENGHLFEVMQKMTDEPVTTCTECGAPVQRVFHPVAVHFKGSGFYNTDYGTSKRKREEAKSSSSSSTEKPAGMKGTSEGGAKQPSGSGSSGSGSSSSSD